eukprot:sb/3474318/
MKSEYKEPLNPPIHMPIAYGPIEDTDQECVTPITTLTGDCCLCGEEASVEDGIYCIKRHCVFHSVCLAGKWCPKGELLPISGQCPRCSTEQLWGEMVKLKARSIGKRKGTKEARDSNHWTKQLARMTVETSPRKEMASP